MITVSIAWMIPLDALRSVWVTRAPFTVTASPLRPRVKSLPDTVFTLSKFLSGRLGGGARFQSAIAGSPARSWWSFVTRDASPIGDQMRRRNGDQSHRGLIE